MNFLEDLRMSLFNINFVMIYIIHKMLVLLKHHMNYLKDNIFKCFLNRLSFFFLLSFLSIKIWKV